MNDSMCRFRFLIAAAIVSGSFASVSCGEPSEAAEEPFRIIFVGTGGPEITVEREGIATLLEIGNRTLLVDAGRNAMQNLYEAGVDPRDVTEILFTHLHNDHVEGLPTLWMTGWFLLGRTETLTVWGPPGTRAMIDGMWQMYRFDMEKRSNEFNDKALLRIDVHEIEAPKVAIDEDGLTVRAIPAEHDDGNPAFGYVIENAGRRVVLTGDTRLYDELPKIARDADVLVSNVLSIPDALAAKPEMQGVVAKLMTIDEAVRLFNAAKPGLAVYSHFVGKELPDDGDQFIEEATRRSGYGGPLFLARDGWSVDVTSLQVAQPPAPGSLPHLDRKASYRE